MTWIKNGQETKTKLISFKGNLEITYLISNSDRVNWQQTKTQKSIYLDRFCKNMLPN
jgi:hypothetical protein